MIKPLISLPIMGALMALSAAMPAAAQIRVDAPIHSAYGSCPSCDLSNKRLNGMKLENANFSKSIFNNSNLSGGVFRRTDLTKAHFRKALLYGFEGSSIKMTSSDFEDATLTEASVTYSVLHKANLRRANLTRANLSHNDFRSADLSDSQAVNLNAASSNFEGAKLDDSNLQDADLTNAVFKEASFGKAILLGSLLQGADFSGANLSKTQGLTQDQLDRSCGDANTQLPAGLFLPFCQSTETLSPASAALPKPDDNSQSQEPLIDDAIILGFGQKPFQKPFQKP